LGWAAWAWSGVYGPAAEPESIATIRTALDAGINLLDSGDYYGMGHNELLIREALRGRDRNRVVISVKFGALRAPDNAFIGIDGRPVAVRNFLAYSLRRLGTDYIDIYRLGRVDPQVPIEETVGAIAEMIAAGYVRHVGCRRRELKQYAAPTPLIRWLICRSSTQCSLAESKRRSCPPAGSWA
jgi:aryl-alcohol dehydrogenase-like predicted oxidoreductase